LNKLFFLSLFFSLTIPRCGIYWHDFPLNIASLLPGVVFAGWAIRLFTSKKLVIRTLFDKTALVFFIYTFILMVIGMFKKEIFDSGINFLILAGGIPFFFIAKDIMRQDRFLKIFLNLVCLSLFFISIYGLVQVFMDIETISLPGITELYGSPKDAQITLLHGQPHVTSGHAWQKNAMRSLKSGVNPVFVGTKIFSTFHHGNIFGSHLASFLPLVIALALAKKKNRISLILLSLLIISGGVNLLFTNSRAALLSFLIGLAVMCFFFKKDFFYITALGVITLLVFISIMAGAIFLEHNITGADPSIFLSYYEVRYLGVFKILFFSPAEAESWGGIDGLTNQRVGNLGIALKNVFDSPSLKELLFGRSFKNQPNLILHNFFINLTYKIGMVGFSLFILLLIILFKNIIHYITKTEDRFRQLIAIGGLAGITAGLAHNLLDGAFYYPPLVLNFWILAGFIVSMVSCCKNN